MKIKKIVVALLAAMIVLQQNSVTVSADADGNACMVAMLANGIYLGSGSIVTSNLYSAATIKDDIVKAFSDGNAKSWKASYMQNKNLKGKYFTIQSGQTYATIDDTDLIFYVGHGVLPGYKNNSSITDHSLVMTSKEPSYVVPQGSIKLGKRDCEWFITFTCNFLEGNMSKVGRMMEGMHTVCGYATDMTVTKDAGSLMASKLKSGMTVKDAFVSYAKKTQQAAWLNKASVMTTNSLKDDHIWGYGTVGSDPKSYAKDKYSYVKYTYNCNW